MLPTCPVISVKYCPDDGLFRPKHVSNIVNTSYLINIVHLLVLHHCSLEYILFALLRYTEVMTEYVLAKYSSAA
jgi:hypothetical protein